MSALPLPFEADATATHDSRDVTTHEQKSSVDSLTDPSPPAGPITTSEGDTFHGHVAASWEIVARWSATDTSTERGEVDRFGWTEKPRSAGPWRVVGTPKVSQSDTALTVHSHSLAVATLIVPDPPADVMLDVLTFRVTAHRCVEGPVRRVVDPEPQPVANAVSTSIEE
jgi:hypothetical protein